MSISFGRDVCTNLATSETREWIVTNGIGGYGAGTISGLLTRRCHGLLIAALQPPTWRTLLLTKLNETVSYNNLNYDLYCDRRSRANSFLSTFARYVDRGMLPNVFPDGGESPDYNTVDATLWLG